MKIEWVKDKDGNSCSNVYFGSIDAARAALNSLVRCRDCTNCQNCTDCVNCTSCTDCKSCEGCRKCDSCIDSIDCQCESHLTHSMGGRAA